MSPSAASLLTALERRRKRGLDAEHRLARERKTLDRALNDLRTGRDATVVVAELRARGMNVTTEQKSR